MKKFWIILAIALLLAIGIFTGIYVYNKNKTQNINVIDSKQLANIEKTIKNDVVSTSAAEEKVSPNAMVLEKQYFKGCDHLIKTSKDIPQVLINKNKEAVEKYYNDWSVDSFSADEITIYKEEEGYCNQHYVVKDHNGVAAIYTLDESGQITFKEDTEIQLQYLPEEDLVKIKNGIVAVGDMELNTILEDFE